MKIWHISDTHGYQDLLEIPENIDMIIHSGDFSNYYDFYKNEVEGKEFLRWFGNLNIKHKVLIAGNHDAFPAIAPQEFRDLCLYYHINYLENESINIEDINIYGTPLTPTFGNWYFMKARHKLHNQWINIPDNTDILIVHGPPKGILDLSWDRNNELKFCGCNSLRTHCLNRLNLKLCLFGHIHNTEEIINAGTIKLSIKETIFSNGSIVTDGRFGKLSSNGNIFEI